MWGLLSGSVPGPSSQRFLQALVPTEQCQQCYCTHPNGRSLKERGSCVLALNPGQEPKLPFLGFLHLETTSQRVKRKLSLGVPCFQCRRGFRWWRRGAPVLA